MPITVVPHSAAIALIVYEPIPRELRVRFKGRKPKDYTFVGVPPDVFHEFILADSIGTYYHENIRGKYDPLEELRTS